MRALGQPIVGAVDVNDDIIISSTFYVVYTYIHNRVGLTPPVGC